MRSHRLAVAGWRLRLARSAAPTSRARAEPRCTGHSGPSAGTGWYWGTRVPALGWHWPVTLTGTGVPTLPTKSCQMPIFSLSAARAVRGREASVAGAACGRALSGLRAAPHRCGRSCGACQHAGTAPHDRRYVEPRDRCGACGYAQCRLEAARRRASCPGRRQRWGRGLRARTKSSPFGLMPVGQKVDSSE